MRGRTSRSEGRRENCDHTQEEQLQNLYRHADEERVISNEVVVVERRRNFMAIEDRHIARLRVLRGTIFSRCALR